MNLVSLSEERIAKFGETTSLVFQGEAYTNIRINKMARKLAAGLKSLGVGCGDHVVVSMPNTPEVFACFNAIWRIGAVIVPIMFLLGEEETRYILDHSDAKLIITSNDLLEKMDKAREGLDHVRHGTGRLNVGQQDRFIWRQDFCTFRHEIHTTENHNIRIRFCRKPRKFERVASVISNVLNLEPLVIVSKNNRVFLPFRSLDTVCQFLLR